MAEPREVDRKRSGAAMCLFGVPGVGKTSLIGTGPDTYIIRPPIDHVDPIIEAGNADNFDDLVITSWGELLDPDQGFFRWCQQGGWKKYKWFWFDSLSLWQDVALQDLFVQAVKRSPHRAEFALDKQEYGINQFRIGKFITDMVGLVEEGKINFGITCHTMEWWDPQNEVMLWAPNIQGREGLFMQKIAGMMHVVAYYYLQKRDGQPSRRILKTRTEKDDVFVKDQLGIGGESGRLVNPTMADINAVLDSRDNGQPPRRRQPNAGRRRKRVRSK